MQGLHRNLMTLSKLDNSSKRILSDEEERIISLFVCGVVMGQYTYQNISQESQKGTVLVFDSIAYCSEAFVFCYLGMSIYNMDSTQIPILFCIIIMFVICLARFFATFLLPCIKFMLGFEQALKIKELKVFWYSGLIRGAIAFAMVLQIKSENKSVLVNAVLVIVVFTITILSSLLQVFSGYVGLQYTQEEEMIKKIYENDEQGELSTFNSIGNYPEDKNKSPNKFQQKLSNFEEHYLRPVFTKGKDQNMQEISLMEFQSSELKKINQQQQNPQLFKEILYQINEAAQQFAGEKVKLQAKQKVVNMGWEGVQKVTAENLESYKQQFQRNWTLSHEKLNSVLQNTRNSQNIKRLINLKMFDKNCYPAQNYVNNILSAPQLANFEEKIENMANQRDQINQQDLIQLNKSFDESEFQFVQFFDEFLYHVIQNKEIKENFSQQDKIKQSLQYLERRFNKEFPFLNNTYNFIELHAEEMNQVLMKRFGLSSQIIESNTQLQDELYFGYVQFENQQKHREDSENLSLREFQQILSEYLNDEEISIKDKIIYKILTLSYKSALNELAQYLKETKQEYQIIYGTKYVWLEMFESFLTRSYVENQELAFYLFVRSMVEKQLKIQIHNVFSHQNLLDFSSSQHNRLKQNSQSSTKLNSNQNILNNQHQHTNINISYNKQNERDENIQIYNDPKDPLNICLNLQHCYKVSQSVFGTQEKQLISDFLDLVRHNINPESGLINFYDFLSLMIQKYQQLVRADKKIKNLNSSKSQEFSDHLYDYSEQENGQQNNEFLHNQKTDRQNLDQIEKQSDIIKEQFEFTLMNNQNDEKEKNKSFSFLNQSINSNLLMKNIQFEKKTKLKDNKQLSFSNQNSSLTSNYEKSNSTTISQEQNYQNNTNEDSKNLIKNKSDKQLVFKEKQQQETLQKQQIEKLLQNQLQIQIQDKAILKLKQFLKLIFSKKDPQLQQISQDKIKSYQQKILCIFSSKISQLIEAIVNQDKIMWLDLLLIENPTQKQLENVECIEREYKYTQQDLLNQYMEDNQQQLEKNSINNNCNNYSNSQGNKQEINLTCFQKIKPQVQQISNKILETQELSHAIGKLIACIKNGITQQTEQNR
ncbi:hypothetical protein PPERSA_04234 [Pseudocohnilembus persalinus]|uniref:Cation/H+ exchanger domain-containing protein n=1 Tax=Pseudocohnilembus persalinus TaxID=266149 RepID=A0A0V0QN92_PSEPJ|nr:hypothetical protein PPERSA_04234 [Pseudocohnilembus persalinus]|eukprot:KRX03726.1 hypothetical protein PPERSA_04234 [Pseudocohnilembus persalinus]